MVKLIEKNYQLYVQEKVKIDPVNKNNNGRKEFEILLRDKGNPPSYPADLIEMLLSSKDEYIQFLGWIEYEYKKLLKANKNHHFSFNISINQISYDETLNLFERLIKYKNRITVELTEDSLQITNGFQSVNSTGVHKEILKRIQKIHEFGFKIAIDDVGSGRNSLETVVSMLPYLDEIKYSLVNFRKYDLDEEQILSFLYTWKHFADFYHLKFVVEGIETVSEVNELIKNNVRYFQGYYFEKPHIMKIN